MRDRSRHPGDHDRAEALADWLADRLAAEEGAIGAAPSGEWPGPHDTEPDASERITLIEFLWEGKAGAQQVILVSRQWLQ